MRYIKLEDVIIKLRVRTTIIISSLIIVLRIS
jgi:hypothetical protein